MAFVQSSCCAELDLSVSASRELNRLRILFDKCGDALLAAHYLVEGKAKILRLVYEGECFQDV
jgi:hypothetical protein